MSAAAMAMHFGTRNHQTQIVRGADGSLDRCCEARPSGPAVEFGVGLEQCEIAARAVKHTSAMFVIKRAAKGPLGPMLAQHAELFRRQEPLPLRLGLDDVEGLRLRAIAAKQRSAQRRKPGEADAGKQTASNHRVLHISFV